MIRKFSYSLVTLLLFAFLFWPSKYQPAVYNASTSYALDVDADFASIEKLGKGMLFHAEDVAVNSQGDIFATSDSGIIYKLYQNNIEEFTNTRGRALGITIDEEGNLFVCNLEQGLQKIDSNGDVEVLVSEYKGKPFGFIDDVDVAPDGKIYFSDATQRFSFENYKKDLLLAKPSGRLFVYNPETQKTTKLLDDLFFANGVAVSKSNDFVLVNETFASRVIKLWISGEKKGKKEIFIDSLPGYLDGISAADDGSFWLTIAGPRSSLAEFLHPYPLLKKIMLKTPISLWPEPKKEGTVLQIDSEGNVMYVLHDPTGKQINFITSAEKYGDYLYFGLLGNNDYIARLPYEY